MSIESSYKNCHPWNPTVMKCPPGGFCRPKTHKVLGRSATWKVPCRSQNFRQLAGPSRSDPPKLLPVKGTSGQLVRVPSCRRAALFLFLQGSDLARARGLTCPQCASEGSLVSLTFGFLFLCLYINNVFSIFITFYFSLHQF